MISLYFIRGVTTDEVEKSKGAAGVRIEPFLGYAEEMAVVYDEGVSAEDAGGDLVPCPEGGGHLRGLPNWLQDKQRPNIGQLLSVSATPMAATQTVNLVSPSRLRSSSDPFSDPSPRSTHHHRPAPPPPPKPAKMPSAVPPNSNADITQAVRDTVTLKNDARTRPSRSQSTVYVLATAPTALADYFWQASHQCLNTPTGQAIPIRRLQHRREAAHLQGQASQQEGLAACRRNRPTRLHQRWPQYVPHLAITALSTD